MNSRRTGCKQGFSLLEVLITTILMVVGVVAVVKAVNDGMAIDFAAENRAVATQLAQEKMESIKGSTSFSGITATPKAAVDAVKFPQFKSEVLVSGSDPKQVTVNVYWDTTDPSLKVTLQTLITNLTPSS